MVSEPDALDAVRRLGLGVALEQELVHQRRVAEGPGFEVARRAGVGLGGPVDLDVIDGVRGLLGGDVFLTS